MDEDPQSHAMTLGAGRDGHVRTSFASHKEHCKHTWQYTPQFPEGLCLFPCGKCPLAG